MDDTSRRRIYTHLKDMQCHLEAALAAADEAIKHGSGPIDGYDGVEHVLGTLSFMLLDYEDDASQDDQQ